MSLRPTPTGPANTTPEDDTAYYRRILHEMIDLGADLARLAHAQAHEDAKAQAATPSPASNDNRRPATDHIATFDRVVRAVRRTILLARTLDAPPRPQPTAALHRTATRKRIIRSIEDAIHSSAGPADSGRMHAELLDRLDSPEFEHDIAIRPAAEIIEDIRADLGLGPMPGYSPWKRRTPADLAILHARAAAPPAPPWPPPARPGA